MKSIRLFFFLCAGIPILANGQVSLPDRLAKAFRDQLERFPQEKIYVHTDKPCYISGEKIWFRTWLVDAVTHIPSPVSRYVYVELINPLDSVVVRVKIVEAEGAYHGYLTIPDGVPPGIYSLRAYSSLMRSLKEDYFFTKTLQIGVLPDSTPTSREDFEVGFYPEGGSLLSGAPCKVAFKALKSNGQAVKIMGKLYDQDDVEVCAFSSNHLGMGSFMLLPQEGAHYFAECEDGRGSFRRYALPDVLDDGYALSVTQYRGNVYITTNKPAGSTSDKELYLLAHTRGMIQMIKRWDHSENREILLMDHFPSGVLHLILLDEQLIPLSERLVFINNEDQAQVLYCTDKENYAKRSLVNSTIALTDSDDKPLTGSFSVSVTSDREVVQDSTTNILTHLLLTSDLRGYIENPAYYFQNTTAATMDLDLLMLTQGWRRFDVAKMVQGIVAESEFSGEIESKVSGKVQNVSTGRGVEGVEVFLASMTGRYYDTGYTDSFGRFCLSTGDLPDSTRYTVSIDSQRGKTELELVVDKESFPERTLSAVPPTAIAREQFAQYALKAELQYVSEGGIRVVQLSAAVVTSTREPKRPFQSNFYDPPTRIHTLNEERLAELSGMNFQDILGRLPGVVIATDRTGYRWILLRPKAGMGEQQNLADKIPLVLLNDMPVDYSILDDLNPADIATIDLLMPGPQSAIFGSRGYNGVISLFYKSGRGANRNAGYATPSLNIKALMPLGYQQPVEFYVPKYETEVQRYNGKPDHRTTIHWQPMVQTDSRGIATFSFYTADESTSYTVTIEGVADDGTIIHKTEHISTTLNN